MNRLITGLTAGLVLVGMSSSWGAEVEMKSPPTHLDFYHAKTNALMEKISELDQKEIFDIFKKYDSHCQPVFIGTEKNTISLTIWNGQNQLFSYQELLEAGYELYSSPVVIQLEQDFKVEFEFNDSSKKVTTFLKLSLNEEETRVPSGFRFTLKKDSKVEGKILYHE